MNLEHLKECPLHKKTPFVVYHVRNSQFSIARHYGGIRYQTEYYEYFPEPDVLIREDVIKWMKKFERDKKKEAKKARDKEQDEKQGKLFDS